MARARPVAGLPIVAALLSVVATLLPWPARAGGWGDASLRSVDSRLTVDRRGASRVQLVVGIRVTGKRFRALTIDGVDTRPSPLAPDGASGVLTDGPGWAAQVVGRSGEPRPALVEPLLGPGTQNKLRIRFDSLELEGLPRGEHTITVAYGVDLLASGSLRIDRTNAALTWAPPRWSEGHDSASMTFVLPAAQGAPQLLLLDPDGHERPVDGLGVVALKRGADSDELTFTRPHVPHDDDTRWLVRFDARGMTSVVAETTAPASVAARPLVPAAPWWMAAVGAVLVGAVLAMRDWQLSRAARRLGVEVRALLPLPLVVRSALAAVLLLSCFALAATGRIVGAGLASIGAMAAATVLASPPRRARGASAEPTELAGPMGGAEFMGKLTGKLGPASTPKRGRWLTVPTRPVVAGEPPVSWLEPRGLPRLLILGCVIAGIVAATTLLLWVHSAWLCCWLLCLGVLFPLFFTGHAAQLRPSRKRQVQLLERLATALRASPQVASVGWSVCPDGADFRLRITPRQRPTDVGHARSPTHEVAPSSARSPVPSVFTVPTAIIEVGCRHVHGLGVIVAVPELIVALDPARARASQEEHDQRSRPGSDGQQEATVGPAREASTFCIRPVDVSPRGVRRAVETLLQDEVEPPGRDTEEKGGQKSPLPSPAAKCSLQGSPSVLQGGALP